MSNMMPQENESLPQPKRLQAPRGMKDLIGQPAQDYLDLNQTMLRVAKRYGYDWMQTPMLEHRSLFVRAVGDHTDIVQKEMFCVVDEQVDSSHENILTLRPEGTASCVRAGIERSSFRHQVQRWAYFGPMFRRERPQKGRYRQFHQFGLECFGLSALESTLEILLISRDIFQELGLLENLTLEINSIGTLKCRQAYQKSLSAYIKDALQGCDETVLARAQANPLRLLDTKDVKLQSKLKNAPKLWDFLSQESQKSFKAIQNRLLAEKIACRHNLQLVRGLDYYNDIVFEWTSASLASQASICGGGRYDALVSYMGGDPTPAVGCAFGIERMLSLIESQAEKIQKTLQIKVGVLAYRQDQTAQCFEVAQKLRRFNPTWKVMQFYDFSMNRQFSLAEQGECLAVVLVGKESAQDAYLVKNLQTKEEKCMSTLTEVSAWIGIQT